MPTQTFAAGESLAGSMQFAAAVNALRSTKGIDSRSPQPSHTVLLVSSTGVEMRRFEYALATGLRAKGANTGATGPSKRTLAKRAARADAKKKRK